MLDYHEPPGGVKLSETFLKQFYKSILLGIFIKYIFHKNQKCAPQMEFNDKKSIVLAKKKNLTILIIRVYIEPA